MMGCALVMSRLPKVSSRTGGKSRGVFACGRPGRPTPGASGRARLRGDSVDILQPLARGRGGHDVALRLMYGDRFPERFGRLFRAPGALEDLRQRDLRYASKLRVV